MHCSLSAIDNYFVEDKAPFAVPTSSGLHETTQSTLFIILIYLHSSIGYALYGMNSDRPAKPKFAFSADFEQNAAREAPTQQTRLLALNFDERGLFEVRRELK